MGAFLVVGQGSVGSVGRPRKLGGIIVAVSLIVQVCLNLVGTLHNKNAFNVAQH
ncbi:MAG: hypothetical protein AB4080_20090 [Trichodesmium sp.]